MYEHNIQEMIEAMRPALRDEKLALALLQTYWRDKVAVVWTVGDVLLEAQREGFACDPEIAKDILAEVADTHDAASGINWDLIRHISQRCVSLEEVPEGCIAVWGEEKIG